MKSWGKPLSTEEFVDLAKQYAVSLNKSQLFPSGTPSYDWFRSFLKRHQNLVLKKSRPLEKKRASVTIEQVYGWHDLLTKIINDHDLVNRPGQIFNCDETGNTRLIFLLSNTSFVWIVLQGCLTVPVIPKYLFIDKQSIHIELQVELVVKHIRP